MLLPDNILAGYKYRSWVQASDDLCYFSFARECKLPKNETNAHYTAILTSLSDLKSPAAAKVVAEAKKLYKQRNGKTVNSKFRPLYDEFWSQRGNSESHEEQQDVQGGNEGNNESDHVQNEREDQDNSGLHIQSLNQESSQRIDKRQYDMLETVNDTVCSIVEGRVKKMKRDLEMVMDCVDELPKDKRMCITNILDWDHSATKELLKESLDSTTYKKIRKAMKLKTCDRSEVFRAYVDGIVSAPATVQSLQIAIRTSPVSPAEFNAVTHEDFRVAERLMMHFLDLIQSPRKPLSQPKRERTAAYITVIEIINDLFLGKNDILDFKWIEVTVAVTDNTKWDGVGLAVDDTLNTGVVLEFAGGLQTHTARKKNSDTCKLFTNAQKVVDLNGARGAAKVFCVLSYELTITFDILFAVGSKYVRSTLVKLPLPTIEAELKSFGGNMGSMLAWRDLVVKTVGHK